MSGRGPIPIACGPLTAVFDDGDLFDIRWGGLEVAQRLYLAVRDEVWNTIPARLTEVRVRDGGTHVRIDVEARHEHGDIAYAWSGTILVDAAGTVSYEMRGRALADFAYCKIGFNVHHGRRTHAGRSFRCRTEDGIYEGMFAADLVPQLVRDGTLTAMTPHYDRIEIDLGAVAVAWELDGDRFELQDHRNWIDANWKSYGTPLVFGFPMTIAAGDELYQRVRMTITGPPSPVRDAAVAVRWDTADPGALPRIGHLLTQEPTGAQLDRLRALRPSHIRVELHPGPAVGAELRRADAVADGLGAALEVAIHVRPDVVATDARAAAVALASATVPVDRVLVLAESSGFSAFRGACPPEVADAVRDALSDAGVAVGAIVSGTPQFFVDVNRDRPDYSRIDGVVFAANPQVHACDRRSVMQNAQTIADVVSFARRLYGDVAIVLSPVDLLGVDGPFPAGPATVDGRPANVDPRLTTAFGAAWTVAALAAMARSRTTSVTLFELVGARGLVDEDGRPSPAAAFLAQVAASADRPLVAVSSDDPDRLAVLAVDVAGRRELLLANLTDQPLAARLPGDGHVELAPYAVVSEVLPGGSR